MEHFFPSPDKPDQCRVSLRGEAPSPDARIDVSCELVKTAPGNAVNEDRQQGPSSPLTELTALNRVAMRKQQQHRGGSVQKRLCKFCVMSLVEGL